MASDAPPPTTTPPGEDEFVWYREDRVLAALQRTLEATIKTHGNNAKAFAWDVRTNFKREVRA